MELLFHSALWADVWWMKSAKSFEMKALAKNVVIPKRYAEAFSNVFQPKGLTALKGDRLIWNYYFTLPFGQM
jgi:hypothetical protein